MDNLGSLIDALVTEIVSIDRRKTKNLNFLVLLSHAFAASDGETTGSGHREGA
jgi:hypothetical protein